MQQKTKLRKAPLFYRQWKIIRNPSDFINLLIKEFGDFVHCRGLISFYLINTPELVKKVLNETHRNFDKNTVIYDRFRNALGNGLVTAEGEHWRRQRKLIQPAFSPGSIKSFFQIMVNSSNRTIERWEGFCKDQSTVNLTQEINVLTLEIAGKSLLSNGFNSVAESILKWTHVINKYSARPPFPVIGQPWVPLPLNIRLRRVLKDYRSFMAQTIKDRQGREGEGDLLSIFLGMRDAETGKGMDESEIAEEVLGIIIGGHESSATALIWVLYELSLNSTVEGKILNEIDHVTGGSEITFSQVGELKYTKMAIQESMRLHPPFWFENRSAMHDVELGGSLIPKGSMIAFSRYALHRNARYWHDPGKFDPSRFDETAPGASELMRSTAYTPFSSGPRVCIGRHFAMLEMVVILCKILQKYKVSISAHYEHKVATNLTMEPKGGLLVNLKLR